MAYLYSVFYELDGIFDIYRTDFTSARAVNCWVNKLMKAGNTKLHFVLRDGYELIQGELVDDSTEFFDDCMRFAKQIDAGQVLTVSYTNPFCYN